MDYSVILRPVIDTMIWLIPAMLLIGLLKSPWAKGHIGELLVRFFAHWQLDKQTYRCLHNVTRMTAANAASLACVSPQLKRRCRACSPRRVLMRE